MKEREWRGKANRKADLQKLTQPAKPMTPHLSQVSRPHSVQPRASAGPLRSPFLPRAVRVDQPAGAPRPGSPVPSTPERREGLRACYWEGPSALWRRDGVLSCTPTWSPIPPQASSHLPLRLSSPEHSTALASQHCCLPTGIKFSFVREQPEAESRLILVVCLGSLRVKGLALKTWVCPHQGCFGSSTQTSHSYWLE